MTRFCGSLLSSTYLYLAITLTSVVSANATPTDALLSQLNEQVVRVQVGLANGGYGVGSGVVVAQDQVVTNCHVVANAVSISVVKNGESYAVSAIKPDWHHDVCIVKAEGLNLPVAKIGSSKTLKYEQPVFTIGYPSFLPSPVSTFGFVKGLYPMDDSVVVRATSTFRLGDSGGGMFDENGYLVGIMTLKSPGRSAYYYNMPVEWVQALLAQPEQAISTKSALPFWAVAEAQWPYFMRVVQPFQTEDWQSLNNLARAWTKEEPNNSEAWFYLAAAEYATKNTLIAEDHLQKVVQMNAKHSQAIYYLGLIADANGKRTEALNDVAMLNDFDNATANELKLAIGITN